MKRKEGGKEGRKEGRKGGSDRRKVVKEKRGKAVKDGRKEGGGEGRMEEKKVVKEGRKEGRKVDARRRARSVYQYLGNFKQGGLKMINEMGQSY